MCPKKYKKSHVTGAECKTRRQEELGRGQGQLAQVRNHGRYWILCNWLEDFKQEADMISILARSLRWCVWGRGRANANKLSIRAERVRLARREGVAINRTS